MCCFHFGVISRTRVVAQRHLVTATATLRDTARSKVAPVPRETEGEGEGDSTVRENSTVRDTHPSD
jgi:hypothetical protein